MPTHRAWLEQQSIRLLDFYRPMLDASGHFVELDDAGSALVARSGSDGQVQQLLTVARAVHSYSLGEMLGIPGCAPIVEQGLEQLCTTHDDPEFGGFLDAVRIDGTPVGAAVKGAYGQAFVLLAASSAQMAGHDAIGLLGTVTQVLDAHFWSQEDGASREAFDQKWVEFEPYRGANSNMHLCEAYLAAADATGDQHFVERAVRIARLVLDRHARENNWMLPEHYDESWTAQLDYNAEHLDDPFRPYGVTVGHLLEWARLAMSIWLASGKTHAWLPECASALFSTAVRVGWDDEHGGLSYTVGFDGRPANPDHYWWPIAEGIAASAFLAQLTGDESYEQWYRRMWDFAGLHLIDHERGGWYAELDATNMRKSGPWHGKPDLYHVLQASLLPQLQPAPSVAGALRLARATVLQ